jgi:hypothetical protein
LKTIFALFMTVSLFSITGCSNHQSSGTNSSQKNSSETKASARNSEGLKVIATFDATRTQDFAPLSGCILAGRVKNIDSKPRNNISVSVSYLKNNQEVSSSGATISLQTLNPGEYSLFKTYRLGNEACGSYKVTLFSSVALKSGLRSLKLTKISKKYLNVVLYITGTVSNTSKNKAYEPMVICESYSDSQKSKFVNFSIGYPNFAQPIEPGKSTKFDVFISDAHKISKSYTCFAQAQFDPGRMTISKK